ncbi:ABC transporter permease, partial [Patescibacteria group bacterium]|nr:ABC transporter permease [Patescibacteria group bacterium]MBU1890029.1 ABC transporter permease [Patescibacteria group bacterium]
MNNSTYKLFIADLKMMFRNRQALFWSLAFPLLFLVIFGLFNFDAPGSFSIAIVDESQTETSDQLKTQILELELFKEKVVASKDEAIDLMKDGDLDGIITIPESYG